MLEHIPLFIPLLMESYNIDDSIERFVVAQDALLDYNIALDEIKAGRKSSHWIWYIFPQLRGLGYSRMSHYFGIRDRAEAEAYLSHPVLGPRLREITTALLAHKDRSPARILGEIDASKVRSCMTLFDSIASGDIFAEVLDSMYGGQRDPRSIV